MYRQRRLHYAAGLMADLHPSDSLRNVEPAAPQSTPKTQPKQNQQMTESVALLIHSATVWTRSNLPEHVCEIKTLTVDRIYSERDVRLSMDLLFHMNTLSFLHYFSGLKTVFNIWRCHTWSYFLKRLTKLLITHWCCSSSCFSIAKINV